MKKILCFFLITAAACLVSAKTFELKSVKAATDTTDFKCMKGASCVIEEQDKTAWLKLSFSEKKYSLAYYYIPRSDFDYYGEKKSASALINMAAPENIWTGYDSLNFDYINTSKQEIKIKFWVLDRGSIASFCDFNEMVKVLLTAETPDADPKYLQMGEVAVTLKPGKGKASVKLTEDILTVDNRRVLDLSDVRAIAFRGNGKEDVLFVNNIRLEGASASAGSLPGPVFPVICPKTGKGYSDKFASACPFCGVKSHIIDGSNKEPVFSSKGLRINADFAEGYAPRGGGGNDQTEKQSEGIEISHYDDSFWENRCLLQFKLAGKLVPGTKIKKAELRLSVMAAVGKPFYPVFQVYSVLEKFKSDGKKKTIWNNQPPVEKLLFVSGVNEGADFPRWFCFDVTDYMKEKIRQKAVFQLRCAISASTYKSPHPLGHYVFFDEGSTDASKKPCLYIETE